MYSITNLHIELTDKCQASCPMCARNYKGGADRAFVGQHEITLEQFKSWFSAEWLASLENFYACGNYGDPIVAQDCLEIFEYVRSVNSTVRLSLNTNGSARSIAWWQALAKLNMEVTFGIDGFENSHVLYRRGTSWSKIIDNLSAFAAAGGRARVDSLVFEHNQDEVAAFEKYMIEQGAGHVNFKSTARFYDMAEFPVEDKQGNHEYMLKPATNEQFKRVSFIKLEEISRDINVWKQQVSESTIVPKCINRKEVYVDARGNVLPCCWTGSDWIEEPLEETLTVYSLRNQMIADTKSKMNKLGIINLNTDSISDINWSNIHTIINGDDKPWVCTKNCNG